MLLVLFYVSGEMRILNLMLQMFLHRGNLRYRFLNLNKHGVNNEKSFQKRSFVNGWNSNSYNSCWYSCIHDLGPNYIADIYGHIDLIYV